VAWTPDLSALGYYPDDRYAILKETISRISGRPEDEICVGNGSIELLRIYCAAVFRQGDRFFTEEPTFGEYALSACLAGASRSGYRDGAAVFFICNPNNPTGILRTRAEMTALLESAEAGGSQIFADEAFIELADPSQTVADVKSDHLFILRSLTKSFGVPGLRFGYGFGDPDTVEQIELLRPPWSVNAFAEAFAIAAFRKYRELDASRDYIRRERLRLSQALTKMGLTYAPSSANYLLIDTRRSAPVLCEQLLHRGILVRDCTSFGLPTSIRIAVKTQEENAILLEAISECLR
jgi:threonine-phosphate decarboxylase